MNVQRGFEVDTPRGSGVVVDRHTTAGEYLVRLDSGSLLAQTHGVWIDDREVTPTGGFRPDVLVFWGTRMLPASETLPRPRVSLVKRYVDDYYRFLAEDPVPEWMLVERRGYSPMPGWDVLLDMNDCQALADWFGGRRS